MILRDIPKILKVTSLKILPSLSYLQKIIFIISLILPFVIKFSRLDYNLQICIIVFEFLLLSLLFTLFISQQWKYAIYFFLIPLALCFALFSPVFSPIDEGAHYDYIKYVQSEKTLPNIHSKIDSNLIKKVTGNDANIERYEAFQPPVYYIFGAVITSFISVFGDNLLLEIYTLRIMGLFTIIFVVYFINKAFDLFEKHSILERNPLFRKISIATVALNPAILTRLTNVSNEQSSILFGTISIYFLFDLVFSKKFNNWKALILTVSIDRQF